MEQVWGKTGAAVLVGIALGLGGCGSDSNSSPVIIPPVPEGPTPPAIADVTGQIVISDESSGFKATFKPKSDLSGVILSALGNDPFHTVSFSSDNEKESVWFQFDENSKNFFSFFGLEKYAAACFSQGIPSCIDTIKLSINEQDHVIQINLESVDLTPPKNSIYYNTLAAMLGLTTSKAESFSPHANGKISVNYDPNWFVVKKNRFPLKDIKGGVTINNHSYAIGKVEGDPIYDRYSFFSQRFTGLESNDIQLQFGSSLKDGNSATITLKEDGGNYYSCIKPCNATSENLNGVQQIRIDSSFGKYDKYSQWLGNYPIKVDISNATVAGAIDISPVNKESAQFLPNTYSLSANNNEAIYSFSGVDKTIGNKISNQSINIILEKGLVKSVSFSDYDYADSENRQYACSINSANPCSGITLDPDGKTFNFKQAKLSGGVVLTGTLKHAGA